MCDVVEKFTVQLHTNLFLMSLTIKDVIVVNGIAVSLAVFLI